MIHSRLSKIVSVVVTFALVLECTLPAPALAKKEEVSVINYTNANDARILSGLVIDDVDAPDFEKPLDDKATVSSAEGVEWDILVLWISDSLSLATVAEEGRSYLPALAFYVPQEYRLEGDGFTVTLSDSLTALFGGQEIITVYDASTGITYILPASLRDFFANAQQNTSENQSGWRQSSSEAEVAPTTSPSTAEEIPAMSNFRSWVEIFCAQNALDAFSDEDLEFILDLIVNKLEPQAVELLLDSFPAFRGAADSDQIGKEIGLYVYYKTGDKDGMAEHEDAPANALVTVGSDAVDVDGDLKYCYMIAVNLSDLALLDDDGNPVRDSKTGKLVLIREGESMTMLENALVGEMLRAIMDDYNRTGMLGATDISNAAKDRYGDFPTRELEELYKAIHYPDWFIEGTVTSVENAYHSRYDMFKMLRAEQGSETTFTDFYTAEGLLYNYLNATLDRVNLYFDLEYSDGYDGNGNEVETAQCRYESGYLATLYLCELAAKKTGESAIKEDESEVAISSERLRAGLNSILERMHNGETLDQVVSDLSPVDATGNKLYANTNDFEAKFIKGLGTETATGIEYSGDEASLQFTTTLLNYLVALENTMEQDEKPNGSILMDFGTETQSPLDSTKVVYSDYLQIVDSSSLVESTVSNDVALAGGGKSDGNLAEESEDTTAMAAETVQNVCETAVDTAPVVQTGDASPSEQTVNPEAPAAEEPAA